MTRDPCVVGTVEVAEVFLQPQIAGLHGVVESQLLEVHGGTHRAGMSIEDADRLGSICKRTRPNLNRPNGTYTISLSACAVLIYGYDVFVGKQSDGLRGHGGKIVSGKQRRSENSPQAHVRSILVGVHAAVADFEHVRIVPMSRSGKARQRCLAKTNRLHARVMVVDVASGTPEIAAYACAPLPHRVVAILAEAVDDWTTSATHGIAHLDVGVNHHLVCRFRRTGSLHLVTQATEIVL